MKRKILGSFIAALGLSGWGEASTLASSPATQSSGRKACEKLKKSIDTQYIGFTESETDVDSAGDCFLRLTYESPKDLLSFVDQSIKKGQNPLVRKAGKKPVWINHEVSEEVLTKVGEDGIVELDIANYLTMEEFDTCKVFTTDFLTKLGDEAREEFKINFSSTEERAGERAGGVCTIHLGFATAEGYRAYVAHMVEGNLDPTSYTVKNADGVRTRIFISAGLMTIFPMLRKDDLRKTQ